MKGISRTSRTLRQLPLSQPGENTHQSVSLDSEALETSLMTLDRLLEAAETIPVSMDDVLQDIVQLQELLEDEAQSQGLSARRMCAIEEQVSMINMFMHTAEKDRDRHGHSAVGMPHVGRLKKGLGEMKRVIVKELAV